MVNQQCINDGTPEPCIEINVTDSDNTVSVFDGLYNTSLLFTPSSTCLPGYWVSSFSKEDVFRYEWSVSMLGYDAGFGIFDMIEDKIWFDVEMYDRAVFCQASNSTLSEGEFYHYHTRAWHGANTYSVYKSQGVLIDTSPPAVGMGRHIRDTDSGFEREIDFTSRLHGIFADWENVFSDVQSGIQRFLVAVGTSPGGI